MTAGVTRTVEGVYYDGRTAARHPVTITVMETGLRIARSDGAALWWPFEEIRQAAGDIAGEPLRLERGRDPAEALVVRDASFAGAIAAYAPRAQARLRKPLRGWPLLRLTLLAVGAAALLGAALYFWGIPLLANTVADVVPVSWEERLGAAVLEQIIASTERCVEPGGVAAIERIVRTISASSPPNPYTYRVTVVQVPDVNAFAAPGGYIVIFRGLLERTPTPEALAGVLAHEMQHVIQRHGTRNLIRALSLRALIAMASGDGGLGRVLEAGGTLAGLRYTRGDEAAADREGMRMLQAARIDPEGLIGFMAALQKEEAGLPGALIYLSNHPATADRLASLRRQAAEAPYTPVPLIPDYPWAEIGNICTR